MTRLYIKSALDEKRRMKMGERMQHCQWQQLFQLWDSPNVRAKKNNSYKKWLRMCLCTHAPHYMYKSKRLSITCEIYSLSMALPGSACETFWLQVASQVLWIFLKPSFEWRETAGQHGSAFILSGRRHWIIEKDWRRARLHIDDRYWIDKNRRKWAEHIPQSNQPNTAQQLLSNLEMFRVFASMLPFAIVMDGCKRQHRTMCVSICLHTASSPEHYPRNQYFASYLYIHRWLSRRHTDLCYCKR